MPQQPEVISPNSTHEEGQETPLTSSAISALEEGDRRSMVATAMMYPRKITVFRKELEEMVTLNEQVAQEMTYSLPRSDKQLIGPSIRFAETVVYCYRNLRAGVEVIDVGAAQLTAEGRVYDCERNNGIAIRVNRNITGKRGRFNQDMIGVTGAAASSIAYRNAVLKYVPKALWNDIWEKSKLAAVGDAASIAKKRAEALKHFNTLGVTNVMIFNTLGVAGVNDIGTDQLVALKAWAVELKGGQKTIEDIFGSVEDEEIERTMAALGWNDTQKRMSRTSFTGRRSDHLAYVKGEAAKAGVKVEGLAVVPAPTPVATATEPPQEEVAADVSTVATLPESVAAPAVAAAAPARRAQANFSDF